MHQQTHISTAITAATDLLKQGECVAIPTETVYGLAANATDVGAVAKIFEIKNRPFFDPLIIHTDSIEKLKKYITHLPEPAALLAGRFWPGPLTLLLPKTDAIPDLVTSGLARVAVRIPHHPLTLQLLSRLDFPLAAPSANPFGYISPTKASHVYEQLQGKLALILDGGDCEVGLESTIVGFENEQPIIYRLGGLSVEAIEEVVGKVIVMPHSSSSPQSPGMLQSHYAPRKPMVFDDFEQVVAAYSPSEIGTICFENAKANIPLANQWVLSPNGNLAEAAAALFSAMRSLDAGTVKVIFAEQFPAYGLGLAINDRLRRASAL